MNPTQTLDEALFLLRNRQFKAIAERASARLYRKWKAFGLRRDLSVPFPAPTAKIPIRVREYTSEDYSSLFPEDDTRLSREEGKELRVRKRMLEAGVSQCYVAIDERTNQPCYMQWLIRSEHNQFVQDFFDRRFPILSKAEALLEGAHTPPAYRGLGIMPEAMARIAEKARDLGASAVLTFVEHDNVPSLKGCKKAGFVPHMMRIDQVFLGNAFRRLHFVPIAADTVLPHEHVRAPVKAPTAGGSAAA